MRKLAVESLDPTGYHIINMNMIMWDEYDCVGLWVDLHVHIRTTHFRVVHLFPPILKWLPVKAISVSL